MEIVIGMRQITDSECDIAHSKRWLMEKLEIIDAKIIDELICLYHRRGQSISPMDCMPDVNYFVKIKELQMTTEEIFSQLKDDEKYLITDMQKSFHQ